MEHINYLFGYSQPQTIAGDCQGADLVGTIETVKYPHKITFQNAGAIVGDTYIYELTSTKNIDNYFTATRGIFGGIIHDVDQYLPQ